MNAIHEIKSKLHQVDSVMRDTDVSDAVKFYFFGLFASEVARIIDAEQARNADRT
jgi:hypothetical protein